METGLTRNRIISELSRSPHGKLEEYVPIGQQATKADPDFMAHLVAWDRIKGQVRDAKTALPFITLTVPEFPAELLDNSFAHIAMLGPRELLKGFRFAMSLKPKGRMRMIRRLVETYLREKEANIPKWNRLALQHRGTLKELYALAHAKPSARANEILFKGIYPAGSLFETVKQLAVMNPVEAAGAIISRKIPFLVAAGALGKKAGEPDLVLALINAMSPTELITNTKMLERLGVKTNPALRGAFEAALERAAKSGKANTLKTSVAAEAIDDEDLKEKLRGVQEKQIAKMGGIDGNWLVLADMSGSMNRAIEVAKHVAGTLAGVVKGKVWLVFFNTAPQAVDVTGLSLDNIKKATEHVRAGGGTSIGCGLLRMLEAKEEIDGIAIVSDGEENNPPIFADVYKRYSDLFGKQVPVYFYHVEGSGDFMRSMQSAGHDMQTFDLRNTALDYYSLPNLIQTMRTNRYSLADEIMAVPLAKLSDIFKLVESEKAVMA